MVEFVRDGQHVWPTCKECGCRLEIWAGSDDALLVHFGSFGDKDARGCVCKNISLMAFVPTPLIQEFLDA